MMLLKSKCVYKGTVFESQSGLCRPLTTTLFISNQSLIMILMTEILTLTCKTTLNHHSVYLRQTLLRLSSKSDVTLQLWWITVDVSITTVMFHHGLPCHLWRGHIPPFCLFKVTVTITNVAKDALAVCSVITNLSLVACLFQICFGMYCEEIWNLEYLIGFIHLHENALFAITHLFVLCISVPHNHIHADWFYLTDQSSPSPYLLKYL